MMMGEAHGLDTFSKYSARHGYHLILGPLFWECPDPIQETIALGVKNPKHFVGRN
jgi:hypothetical protein